jgi:hypothetical protein
MELTVPFGVSRAARKSELAENATFWLFAAGLAWAPFLYGSNDRAAWGINAVLFPGLAALYEISLLIRHKPHPVAVRSLAIPAGLFAAVVLWIILQVVTSAPAIFVNPIYTMASDALEKQLPGSISVNRDLTNLALMRLLTAASVFWLAVQLCRNSVRAIRLIGSIALIGAAYAAYGVVVVKTGQLPWLEMPENGMRVSSTFVNRNSFATYAGLGLIAIAGLTLSFCRERIIRGGSWRLRLATFIDATGQQGALLIAGGFMILVALLLTGSRGGVISTAIGLLVLGVLTRWHSRKRGESGSGALIFVHLLVMATLVVFGSTFANSLSERGLSDPHRISVYLLTLRSIFDAPFLGFGYGTFRDVFPMYRDRSIGVVAVWGQAHDTYLEVLQGLGLVFGTALIAAVVVLVGHCVKGSLRRQKNAIVPQIATSAACLVGVHALVDFSLQMQAVALTFMALLGAGVSQAESSRVSLED